MRGQKGITLIALIITIIVMLILVVTAVSVAINSGLFQEASDATTGWNASETNETNLDQTVEANGAVGIDNIVNSYTNAADGE